MSFQFDVLNVSPEFIMDVAKVIASSPHPLSKKDVFRSFDKSRRYVSDALTQCLQLGLIILQDDLYVSSERYRDLIKRSERSQLFLPLRQALQRYPPFLLYIDFISKGYSSEESTKMTVGIFRIQAPQKTAERSFRNWGLRTDMMKTDSSGNLCIPEAEEGLPSAYIERLVKALRADLQARIFLIETMSQQAYAYLAQKEIEIDDLADALINYETEPKTSANKACQTFEHFLFKLGEDIGANVSRCNGIMEYADEIRRTQAILKNQLHVCHGIGALRNMAHHDPDKETGKMWTFTPQGGIISTLIVPTTIRSLHLHWKEGKQEF
jgi:hypothetical protein